MNWKGKKVLVTGGASFIGSHLVDALVRREALVAVIDNLSSGKIDNLLKHIKLGDVEFRKADLRIPNVLSVLLKAHRTEYIFHLAADHGGRGYVDLHNAQCAGNLALDGIVFRLAAESQWVKKVIYASSGCVYPNHLQTDTTQELFLTEDLVGPPYLNKPQDADNMYGWAKLMAEMTLHALVESKILPAAASCRYFTVYGPRGKVDHAVMAMLARAYAKQDPFEVWGDGAQVRNWTHVRDIVSGTLAAAECKNAYCAVNLGTRERIKVLDAAQMAVENANRILNENWHPDYVFLKDMPTGPLNRVCDNSHASRLLDWRPTKPFEDGLKETADWFFAKYQSGQIAEMLGNLTEK